VLALTNLAMTGTRNAYYGPNIDIYDASVPIGAEVEGRGPLEGLVLAGGPQVYWGANPGVFARYSWNLGRTRWTLVHQEDIAQQGAAADNRAIPQLVTRKSALAMVAPLGPAELTAGGIFAGSDRLGMTYEELVPSTGGPTYNGQGFHILEDEIRWIDTLGGKAKLTWEPGRTHIYVQGAYRGLVADGGPDETVTFTGWSLKDGGQGNGVQLLSGVAIDVGALQIAPNFLYQRPFVGALPALATAWDPATATLYPGLSPRNSLDDPFAVLGNRETVAGELMLVWDPTPGTWFWAWDNALHEDAPLAGALNFVYRHQPTQRDAMFGFDEEGTLFAFSDAPVAADVWLVDLLLMAKLGPVSRLIVGAMGGQEQSTGDSDRMVNRSAVTADLWLRDTALKTALRWNDWGPYDYHQTFNLTFPFQASADLSTGVRGFTLDDPGTRVGARFKYRTFDAFSPDPMQTGAEGHELELFTYLSFRM